MDYNISKYNYTKTENDTQLYIFEIVLKTIDNENKTFRCIKKKIQGTIDIDDIQFHTMTKTLNNKDWTSC